MSRVRYSVDAILAGAWARDVAHQLLVEATTGLSSGFAAQLPHIESALSEHPLRTAAQQFSALKNWLDECHGLADVQWLLRRLGLEGREVKWAAADLGLAVQLGRELYVIPEPSESYPTIHPAGAWIDDLHDGDLNDYVRMKEPDFWEDVGSGLVMYHATKRSRLDPIETHGLEPRAETRGISNRSTGSAVFLGPDIESVRSYGDVFLAVDVSAMKRAGVRPPVTLEHGVSEGEHREAIAHRMGYEGYTANEHHGWDGIRSDTVVVHGRIPSKFLRVIDR